MQEEKESIDELFYEACNNGNLDEVLNILYYNDNGARKLLQSNTSEHLPYFHLVCLHGYHDIVEQLFGFDVDVNMMSRYTGGTPLSVACQGGHLQTVQKLIEHGALIHDPNIMDFNMLPIFQACHYGNFDVFNYILCQKPEIIAQYGHQLLLKACHFGFLDMVVTLVSRQVDVNGIYHDGFERLHNNNIQINNDCPLHVACMQGHIEIIQYLLQQGAEVTTGIVEQFYNELESVVQNRYFKEHCGKYRQDFKERVFDVDMRNEDFYAVHQQWFLTSVYSEHLVDIDLSNNHLHLIPNELFNLTGLKKIDVSGNDLFELPEIYDVTKSSLEEITASKNSLSSLPNSFFQIKSLQHLNASHNIIEQLEHLDPDVTDVYLKDDVAWHCSSLKSLNLSNNKLQSLPAGIHGANSLEKLLLTDNKLQHFPVAWRSPMRILDLSKNNLQDFEESIFTAWKQTVEDLNLSHNHLTTIAWDICQIDTLQRLNMSHNKIDSMPPMSYWTCKNLRRLTLSYNMLCGVQYSLNIPRQRLSLSLSSPTQDLDMKKEDYFPYEVFGTTLEALFLDHNQLNEIPTSLCQLRNLEELDLSWNPKLKTLPNELGNLIDCHMLGLEGLHLTGIPRYVRPGRVANSKDLLTFLRAKDRKSVPYNRMKLMVVGHQGRGKTTLLAALRGKPLPENISTVGIVVNEWTLATNTKWLFKKSNITFSTWDLAGQHVYYSTHQCFLSSNTLYLAVWNTSHGHEGIDKLKPWLLNVQARAPGSSVILIGTHIDLLPKKTKKIRSDKLKQDIIKKYRKKGYPLIKGNFLVSCTTGENISELRNSICQVALQMKECVGHNEPLIGRMVPLSYLKLQENVMKESVKRRNEVKVPILNEKEMLELAAQDPNNDILTRDELLLAARFLHENGVILHYNDRSRGLDQLFFIEPEWLCDVMALLVTVKENNNLVKDGIVKKSNVKLLLRHPRLPQMFMEQYIQLMERFEVALILDEHHMLVPTMLPREKPGLQLSQLSHTTQESQQQQQQQFLVRLYKMNYVPSGFWSRLIARLMIAVQKWGAEEALENDQEIDDEKTTHSGSIRPVPCSYSLIYWREGIGVLYDGGHLMVESFTDKERHGFTEAIEDIEGVKVTVWSAEQDFSVLGFVTDQIDSLIAEWYPGLEENDNFGVPLVRHLIPCPTCVARANEAATIGSSTTTTTRTYSTLCNLRRTTSCDSFASFEARKPQEFSLTECAAAAVDHKEITCPNHVDKPVKLDCLVPDLTLSDLPQELLIDPKYFSFNPVEDNRLGSGGAGEVFLGSYKKQKVAIKRFYSTKESWRDSGIHSVAYNPINSRYTDGIVSNKRAVFTTPKKIPIEEELQRSKILSSFWELRQEVTVLARLNHPCIVSLIGVCVQPLSIVLELSPFGSLYSILEKELKKRLESKFSSSQASTIDIQQTMFDRELTYRIIYQVINALCYLHEAGIIYRDLKSDNLLVWSLEKDAIIHIKLSDYGISRFATPQGMLGEEGTPGFQAPEIRHGATYNEKVDIFSFAMVIYEVFSGYRPYHECRSSSQIKKSVRQGDRPSLEQNCIDSKMPELESLMTRCWRENLFARPSAVDIATRMQDASFLCLTRVLPYADQKPLDNITAFIALSTHDQVFNHSGSSSSSSDKGTDSVLIWGGENEERYYSIIDCNTGFVQLPATICTGPRVSSIVKVGDRFWLGTEGLSIDVFGRPKYGEGELRVLWSIKLKAPVLSLLIDKQSHDFCVRRVFVSLANGKVVVISQGKDRKEFSTSGSFYFRSDANEKLRQEAAIFSVLTTIDVGNHQTPVCCMVFVNDKQQLWVGCANHISVIDMNNLEVIHKFRVYASPRTNVRAMVTDGKSVFTINRQSAIIRQWDISSYTLLYNLNCDLENPQGCIISTKMTNDHDSGDEEMPKNHIQVGSNHHMVKKGSTDDGVVTEDTDEPKMMPDIPKVHQHPPSLMRSLRRSTRHHLRSPRIRSRAQGVSHINQRITCALVVDGMLWLGRGTNGDILVVDITGNEEHGRVLGVLSLGKEQGFIKGEIDCLQLIGGDYILSCANLCREKQMNKNKKTASSPPTTNKKSFMTATSPFKTMLETRTRMDRKDNNMSSRGIETTQSEQHKETNQLAIWLRWQKNDFQRFFNYHDDLKKTIMQ